MVISYDLKLISIIVYIFIYIYIYFLFSVFLVFLLVIPRYAFFLQSFDPDGEEEGGEEGEF